MHTLDSDHLQLPSRPASAWLRRTAAALAFAACSLAAQADTGAQQVVLHLNRALADAVATSPADTASAGRIAQVASTYADFDHTAELVLGDAWSGASSEQRHEFTTAFRTLLLHIFSEEIAHRLNATTIVSAPRTDASARVARVRTRVDEPGRPEKQVDYHLHRTPQGWKLFDVTVDGVGIVATYRSSLRARVRLVGLDGLINELAERNRELGQAT